jgi:hypothetical protein
MSPQFLVEFLEEGVDYEVIPENMDDSAVGEITRKY